MFDSKTITIYDRNAVEILQFIKRELSEQYSGVTWNAVMYFLIRSYLNSNTRKLGTEAIRLDAEYEASFDRWLDKLIESDG